MSQIVNFQDLRPGDVVVLSGGVVCTVIRQSGHKVMLAPGAANAINVTRGEEAWDHQLFPPGTDPEDMNLLVLHRLEEGS
jgi:preprotein translocase subunit YajC